MLKEKDNKVNENIKVKLVSQNLAEDNIINVTNNDKTITPQNINEEPQYNNKLDIYTEYNHEHSLSEENSDDFYIYDHEHHHHHHHEEGEAEEYGIGTFVYYRRKPFDSARFDEFVARFWPKSVIRAKGLCYFAEEYDICYVFEQAGHQVSLRNAGQWYATMPKDELHDMMEREAGLRRDWDEHYGDRMQKLVFIGQHLDKEAISAALDKCLVDK